MLNTQPLRTLWRDWRGLIIIVVLLIIVRSAVADWYTVPSGSMKPTIIEGDRVFVNKVAYGLRLPFSHGPLALWGKPERGEIVVFSSPIEEMLLIKRVIGLPGDTLEMRDNRLLINGRPVQYDPADKDYPITIWQNDEINRDVIDELLDKHRHPIALTPADILIEDFGPLTVPPDHFFMMGDNRHNSADSREIGFIERSLIRGRASHVVLSIDYDNYFLPRKDRTLTRLP